MKVVITATGETMDSEVDLRFGRARYFIVVDTESGAHEIVENSQNLNAVQGAGIQAGRNVADVGAEAVITGNVGPKAYRTLAAAGIKVYLSPHGTVREALERFKDGALPPAAQANVEGHWA